MFRRQPHPSPRESGPPALERCSWGHGSRRGRLPRRLGAGTGDAAQACYRPRQAASLRGAAVIEFKLTSRFMAHARIAEIPSFLNFTLVTVPACSNWKLEFLRKRRSPVA